MTRLRLPIGIQTFREIREGGFYYVDKTGFAKRLVEEGKHYFLSRPRRFGKSLFLDTLKELFEGNEPLFRGLEIHADRDWSERHPVVRLSWGGADFRSTPLADIAEARLEEIEGDLDVTGRPGPAPVRLRRLIRALHRKTGRRAVVLVDEYDKPILDVLGEPETARRHRDYLRGLYGVVKDADAYVRFSFFTGVSRFTRVSLFSELNNLTDITLAPSYSSLPGERHRAGGWPACSKPGTSTASRRCSGRFSRASPSSGTRRTPWGGTRATTPASSIRTARPPGSKRWRKTAAAGAGWISPCTCGTPRT